MNNSGRKRNGPSTGYWILAIILTCTGYASFIGIMMIIFGIIQLVDENRNTPNRTKMHPYDQQRANAASNAAARTQQTARKRTANNPKQRTYAQNAAQGKANSIPVPQGTKGLNITGGILSGIGGLATLTTLAEYAGWASLSILMPALAPCLCILFAGLAILAYTAKRSKKYYRFKRYLTLIGDQKEVSLEAIERTTGYSHAKVVKDLQEMLDKRYIRVGYIDLYHNKLVLTSSGVKMDSDEKDEVKVTSGLADDPEAVLEAIQSINDAIADPEVSAEIDKIKDLTKKILDYIKIHPKKAGQVNKFMSYYLPTTVKILNSYAQLENQGLQGQNIEDAKVRVRRMLEQVTSGFEKQLELLMQDDVMDLDSEVAVMEQMLKNDGLSSEDSITSQDGTTLSI